MASGSKAEQWFAGAEGLKLLGPYATEAEGWAALAALGFKPRPDLHTHPQLAAVWRVESGFYDSGAEERQK